ncbi:MAG: recombinase family protein [Candidatus Niameybacter stercoravium]|nr:recombinase family protein [Candidatus Niameybacter stercoravium]
MKCAIYIRVSTDKEEQKSSLKNQRELFINFIQEHNWELYDFYVDIESGTTSNRENLNRLIKDMEQRKFSIILAKELSRLARNGELSYRIKNLAENNKIDIVTLDNAINTIKGNRSMFGLYAWLYEQESQRISERVKHSLTNKIKRGEFKGSIPPYGYKIVDGQLQIRDEYCKNIVIRIFKDYLSGKGQTLIANELTREGIPTPAQVAGKANASNEWHASSIKLILHNPHYLGHLVQGRQTTISVTSKARKEIPAEQYIVVENTHEAIIDEELFNEVQHRLTKRKKVITGPNTHLFSNLLICSDCRKGFHYKANSKGYVCGTYDRRGTHACSSHRVREATLTQAVIKELNQFIQNSSNTSQLKSVETSLLSSAEKLEALITNCQNQIAALNEQKNKALGHLINDIITREEYQVFTQDISSQIAKLKEELAEYEKSLDDLDKNSYLKEIKKISAYGTITELNAEILTQFINSITIDKEGKPTINYRFTLPSNSI